MLAPQYAYYALLAFAFLVETAGIAVPLVGAGGLALLAVFCLDALVRRATAVLRLDYPHWAVLPGSTTKLFGPRNAGVERVIRLRRVELVLGEKVLTERRHAQIDEGVSERRTFNDGIVTKSPADGEDISHWRNVHLASDLALFLLARLSPVWPHRQ